MPLALSPRHSTIGLLGASALVTALLTTACSPSAAPAPVGPTTPPGDRVQTGELAGDRVVTAGLHGRTGARLVVGDAASRVEVRMADLPGLLYRVSTPAGSGLRPSVSGVEGRLRLRLSPTGDDGPDTVTILLNRSVRWDLRLPAGAGEQHLDLTGGAVTRLDLGASGLAEIVLPPATGTVPVRLTGGVGSATVAAAAPLRITLRKGAGAVSTPWVANNGAAAGAVLMGPGWSVTRNRYAFYARAGLGSLTIRASP